MTGLVWRDTLTLSAPQWAALVLFPLLSLLWQQRKTSLRQDSLWMTAILFALLGVFFGEQIGIDVRITWNVLPQLLSPGWLTELGFINYLKFQPPIWTWWLRFCPSYPLQQGFSLLGGAVLLSLAYRHGGKAFSSAFLASPLFLLLTVLPSNDWWSVVFLSLAVVLRKRWFLSSCLLCVACTAKYSSYVMLPLLVFWMPRHVVIAILWIGAYWTWAKTLDQFWVTEQWRYLCHVFSLGYLHYFVYIPEHSSSPSQGAGVLRTIYWRVSTLAFPCFRASLWYLFPLYLHPPIIFWIGFCGLILGYGNIKYLSLLFPLMFLQKPAKYTKYAD